MQSCPLAPASDSKLTFTLRRTAQRNFALIRSLLGVLPLAFLLACAAPPDPSSFARETDALAASVRQIGEHTSSALRVHPETQPLAADFERHWSARNRALEGAAEYSRTLATVFIQSGEPSPDLLAESLRRLARAVGVGGAVDPIAPALRTSGAGVGVGVLGATADTIAFIHAQIALVQASRTLAEAITRAQPVIDRLAAIIAADTSDVEQIIGAASTLERLTLTNQFDETLAFAASIDRRRSELRRVSYSDLTPENAAELARADQAKAATAIDLEPYFKAIAAINKREAASLQTVRAVRAAITSWADCHRTLAESLLADRPVDTIQLTRAIASVQSLLHHLQSPDVPASETPSVREGVGGRAQPKTF